MTELQVLLATTQEKLYQATAQVELLRLNKSTGSYVTNKQYTEAYVAYLRLKDKVKELKKQVKAEQ